VELKPNRWVLVDDDLVFDTLIKGKGNGPGRSNTTVDTAGCSCELKRIQDQCGGESTAPAACPGRGSTCAAR